MQPESYMRYMITEIMLVCILLEELSRTGILLDPYRYGQRH